MKNPYIKINDLIVNLKLVETIVLDKEKVNITYVSKNTCVILSKDEKDASFIFESIWKNLCINLE